jgi:hypothetical protein
VLAALLDASLETRPNNRNYADQRHRVEEDSIGDVVRTVKEVAHSVASPVRMVGSRLVFGSWSGGSSHGSPILLGKK